MLARSMFLGSGSYGAHCTGDNGATWGDLQYSIVSVINSGMFGVPMVGADICGFNFETNEELCIRWTQVGSSCPPCVCDREYDMSGLTANLEHCVNYGI